MIKIESVMCRFNQQGLFFYLLRHKQLQSFERTQCLFIFNKLSIKDLEVSNSRNCSDSKKNIELKLPTLNLKDFSCESSCDVSS